MGGGSRVVGEILPENKQLQKNPFLRASGVQFNPVAALFCFAFLVYNSTDKRVI